MTDLPKFIIVDDDPFNNKICTANIKLVSPHTDIATFTNPVLGFEHVTGSFADSGTDRAIILLDLNMPLMTGWEFIDRFEQLDPDLKSRIKIYILSSSVDKTDIYKAEHNKNVAQYLIKPLTKETIKFIVSRGGSLH